MDAIGTDINPTARMISFSKTTDYNMKRLKAETEKVLSFLEESRLYLRLLRIQRARERDLGTTREVVPKEDIGEISCAIERISEVGYMRARLFLQEPFQNASDLFSFQRNGEFKLYRMPADKRDSFYQPLLPKLKSRIDRNLEGLSRFVEKVSPDTDVKIHNFNTVHSNGQRHFPSSPCADIVVTSPPYGDSGTTVAYGQFSWLSNVWLGLDDKAPGALDREMMGGRKSSLEEFGCTALMMQSAKSLKKIRKEQEK